MKYLNVYFVFAFSMLCSVMNLDGPAQPSFSDIFHAVQYQNTPSTTAITPTANSSLAFAATQSVDSLALVAIYNATNGFFWTSRWNLSQPVSTWFGVDLDSEGYVIEIHLNNNRLDGTIPTEIGDFSRLQYLQLDNNNLRGNIPVEIGQLSELSLLFIDDNDLSGDIPEELSNCRKLMTVFIDNNRLTGAIPQGFSNMISLQTLDIFNNELDSLPDLTGANLQYNKFKVTNNRFTFDDIIPNLGSAMNNRYAPQDSVFTKSTVNVTTGSYYKINLGFDSGISDNVYQWYKNNSPYGPPSNSNTLVFPAIDWTDLGNYRCVITNPAAPLLTLYSRTQTLTISCGTSQYDHNESLCPGEERIINGITYNQLNPSGTQTLPAADRYGCDSIINVSLNFSASVSSNYSPTLCDGASEIINGTTYNQSRPSGTETFTTAQGCDSIVNINISFLPIANSIINDQLCAGDSRIVNGSTYNQLNPSGTEMLTATNGCDSIITINLQFLPSSSSTINDQLCSGDSRIVNGTTYDQSRPSGTEMLPAANGCDSTITINLQFLPSSSSTINDQLCSGDSRIINGTTYDQSRPSGTEIIPAANGCDSTITINLQFSNAVNHTISDQLCAGSSMIINGTTYDQSQSSGTEMLTAANGCDSIITVNLQFINAVNHTINDQLCAGSSMIINGTTYDQSQPSGTEMLTAANGCDSIITVNLQFINAVNHTINDQLCSGSSMIINGTTYDQNQPNGTEMLTAANGCDSIITINLQFVNTVTTTIDDQVCSGGSLVVNGTTYDESNPSGTEMLTAANGCDSVITVNLSFISSVSGLLESTLCDGDQLVINGTTYDQSNPSGTEVLSASNGCDSILTVNLNFVIATSSSFTTTLCDGESIMVNGTIFDQSNPSGMTLLPGASQSGCDSMVVVQLNFLPSAEGNYVIDLCEGTSLDFNGTTYDQSNDSGVEVLPAASARGCDSIVNVQVNFIAPPEGQLMLTLCEGSALTYNSTVYDMSNPSGTELLPGGSQLGCDSIVHIELQFKPFVTEDLALTLCEGESISVDGTTYDQANPSGTVTFSNGSVNGCDSIVNIQLDFVAPISENLQPVLCAGEVLIVNGAVYDESRPSGTEVLPAAAANGCDSIIIIDINFNTSSVFNMSETLCAGEQLIVNGTVYDRNQPSGTEIFAGASSSGCDSVVQVSLDFIQPSIFELRTTLCSGEHVMVNGVRYDENQATGVEIFSGAALSGCDSIVQIELNFLAPVVAELRPEVCEGASFSLNGSVYDSNQPSGTEVLVAAAANGCDSIVNIELNFVNAVSADYQETLCEGASVLINGTRYDETRPSGEELLVGAASTGCDSIIRIQLSFLPELSSSFSETICQGETYLFDGQGLSSSGYYTMVLPAAGQLGCDSTVHLQLEVVDGASLAAAVAGDDQDLCSEDFELEGQLPAGSSGLWSTASGAVITDPSSPNSVVEGLTAGEHFFVWTLSTDICANYDQDTLYISLPDQPMASDDEFEFPSNALTGQLDLMTNDEIANQTQLTVLDLDMDFDLAENINGNFDLEWAEDFSGEIEFQYQLCHDLCFDLCDTALVRVNILASVEPEVVVEIPNGFTPNGDNVNDTFVIPFIEENPSQYENAELTVFNRWGDILYKSAPYQNDWDGTGNNGKPLPLGTYYYVLRLDLANGLVYKGDITILK